MKIYIARYGGVCFGVERAIKIALESVEKGKKTYSYGPLIHNRLAVDSLRRKGIVTVDDISDIKNKRVIIRSHGVHPRVLRKLKRKKFEIIDATCPRVRRAQRYVEKLINEGYYVIIIGEKDHPEVKGLLGYGRGKADIYSPKIKLSKKKIGVVSQTTLDLQRFNDAIAHMISRVLEMKIYNTICRATILRIHEATRIAKKADMMIVIGGKNSSNTTRLYEVCHRYRPSYHIESPDEISDAWFENVKSIGITAGASTPKDQIDTVIALLRKKFPDKK
jgi:4-hydroxy-3-methylbut-2-enyl diphosphate reductase